MGTGSGSAGAADVSLVVDRESLKRVLGAELAWLYRLARALTTPDRAEDLAHETVVRVLSRSTTAEVNRAYLRAVMTNLLIDEHRRQRRRPGETGLDEATISLPVADPDAPVDLQRALMELSTLHRTALVLRYLENLPTREVAELVGQAPSSVRRLLAEARRKLRPLLEASIPPGS